MNAQQHWERVYRTKRPNEVSWYAPHLGVLLRLIEDAASDRDAEIIDVGGGEATLVDDLLDRCRRRVFCYCKTSDTAQNARAAAPS